VKFEDAKRFIEEYVDKTDFRPTYDTIMSQINCMMNGEPLTPFNSEIIKSDIRKLYMGFFSHSTEFEYVRFMEACSEMIHNWNDNTIKDPDITVYTTSLKILVAMTLNMKNSITAMKATAEKFRRLRGWAPATTDITLAYLESLMKQSENK
jgi:hypothetical protein